MKVALVLSLIAIVILSIFLLLKCKVKENFRNQTMVSNQIDNALGEEFERDRHMDRGFCINYCKDLNNSERDKCIKYCWAKD